MNQQHRKQALQSITDQCVHCGEVGSLLDIQEVEKGRDAELLHVKCQECRGALLVLLFTAGPLVNSVGLITDLSKDDALTMQGAKPWQEDDLFALHEALKDRDVTKTLLHAY